MAGVSRRTGRLLVVTAGLTYVLMLLGLYTGAVGAGLSCSAQWPLCSGGLFPETLPGVPEWAHRTVAGITGLFIVGSAVAARRDGADRRVRLAAWGAVVAVPLQYAIGALTVTFNGLLPWGFSGLTRVAHFSTALGIFGLVLAATAWAHVDRPRRRARRAGAAALAALPVHLALTRGVIFEFAPLVQVLFYAASLALFAALFVATLWFRDADGTSGRIVAAGAASIALLYVELVLGRGLLPFTRPVRLTTYFLAVLVAVAVIATVGNMWPTRPALRTR